MDCDIFFCTLNVTIKSALNIDSEIYMNKKIVLFSMVFLLNKLDASSFKGSEILDALSDGNASSTPHDSGSDVWRAMDLETALVCQAHKIATLESTVKELQTQCAYLVECYRVLVQQIQDQGAILARNSRLDSFKITHPIPANQPKDESPSPNNFSRTNTPDSLKSFLSGPVLEE